MKADVWDRRSLGIGIIGLAEHLHNTGGSYSRGASTEKLAEMHYFHCLKASQELVEERKYRKVEGIKVDWLPIDTKRTLDAPALDWESLRGKPRANSVLVAHMPTESSSLFSNSTNGLYPVRQRVISKQSRKGLVQYIAPDVKETAWEVAPEDIIDLYACVQGWTDQAISADYYAKAGKVSLSQMMKDWVYAARLGIKTMYYLNTEDSQGATLHKGCEGGSCTL